MERFWNKVNKLPGIDACWLWAAGLNSGGYGQFKLNGKVLRAHQVSWKLQKGWWSAYLCHTCDNNACVNPDHLYDGTPRSNMDDKYNRGRASHPIKYSDHIVRRIRREYATRLSSSQIAEKYNLPKATVIHILNGDVRKDAGGPIRDRSVRYWSNRYGSGKTGDKLSKL